MALNWINPSDYPFNALLLMERFQIRLMFNWFKDNADWIHNMGLALSANPAVTWYLSHRSPECISAINQMTGGASVSADAAQIRNAEVYVLSKIEDFVVYTTPEVMAKKCDFIRGWNKERLFELVDLSGKTVLDVGAGSGRLAFAAAEKARWVYASEPVGTLREFMRDKALSEGIKNIRILDGYASELPFPDNTFDVVMSGHVVGDEIDAEISELKRVCKPGGWLIDCVGDSEGDINPKPEMISRGWEEVGYIGSFGKLVCNYRKLVIKK